MIAGPQAPDEVPVEGVGHGYLVKIEAAQQAHLLQQVPGVGEGHPRGDDARSRMGAVPGREAGGKLRLLGDLVDLGVQLPVQLPQVLGGGAPAPGVLLEAGRALQHLRRA